ncbi:MAG: hypothetical protein M0Q21_03600 [Ignavibacteriaceae bacterium]|nr:hypothetical protein [Ignavibacteriaceae bacterium]
MTAEQFNQVVAYLRDPNRNVLIEVELPNTAKQRFETTYTALTNNYPLPANSTQSPYYVWGDGANKWGIESRLYFISDANLPAFLANICVNNTRHDYRQYDMRINNNEFIYDLFSRGFILGDQIHGRIL